MDIIAAGKHPLRVEAVDSHHTKIKGYSCFACVIGHCPMLAICAMKSLYLPIFQFEGVKITLQGL